MSISLIILLWACCSVYSFSLFALAQKTLPTRVIVQSVLCGPIAALVWTICALSDLWNVDLLLMSRKP